MGFGERLKRMRKTRNLSMQELAGKIGVAKSTYAGYEAEYRQPTLESIIILAKELNTSADYLLGLTENQSSIETDKNAHELLKAGDLHWDGIPLTGEDLKVIRAMIELVAKERSQRQQLEEKTQMK
nr:helix-turn-helix transcriptional regulator [Neobacillus sp. Marseille-Q6967]